MSDEIVLKRKTVKDNNASDMLRFLYENKRGQALLRILTKPVLSELVGKFMDTRISTVMINGMIKKSNIDMNEYEEKAYVSYNDFFTRKVKEGSRPVDMNNTSLISPCDSKLSVYTITEEAKYTIKGSEYSVYDILGGNKTLADKYINGKCLIFRLAVDDYHRYIYIDNAKKSRNVYIKGILHTVQGIALKKYNVYKRNSREYTLMRTENFGDVVQVEVGAMMVGKIDNYHGIHSCIRGEEKGHFKFGGSTIVLLLREGAAEIDEEIEDNTSRGLETVVKCGEKIGRRLASIE